MGCIPRSQTPFTTIPQGSGSMGQLPGERRQIEVPKGHPKVARRFIAGFAGKTGSVPDETLDSPGTGGFHPSLWDGTPFCDHPAINRRATFDHSYGMAECLNQTFAEISHGTADISLNSIS